MNITTTVVEMTEINPTIGSDFATNFDISELDLPRDLKNLTGTLTRPNGKEELLELGVGPDNLLAVNFLPEETGKYLIGIEKNGNHVQDSPFEIIVDDVVDDVELSKPGICRECGVMLEIPELDLSRDKKNITADLTRPSGKKELLEFRVGPDNTLAVNFISTETGKHLVDVKKNGCPVNGSPFEVDVAAEESVKKSSNSCCCIQ